MAYSDANAGRVRGMLARRKNFKEKKMFGGVGFLLNGNMCVGVWREFLILRVGPDKHAAALAEPYTKEFDITGRPMKGWLMIEPDGFADDAKLEKWITFAVQFVRTLPAK